MRYLRPALIVAIGIAAGTASEPLLAETFSSGWSKAADRVWVGPEYWANRLQDWRIRSGRLECVGTKLGMRTVHLLTRRIGPQRGKVEMSVQTGLLDRSEKSIPRAARTGFLIGAGAADLDYRAAALVQRSPGPDGGYFAGLDGAGHLIIRSNITGQKPTAQSGGPGITSGGVLLKVTVQPSGKRFYRITLSVHSLRGSKRLGQVSLDKIPPQAIIGNIALVSQSGGGKRGARFWFRDWSVSGTKVETHDDRNAGPILCTQYTLSRNVMKLTAQMMPIGIADNQTVQLQTQRGDRWKTIAQTKILAPSYTAPFRVAHWDSTKDTPYRVAYSLRTTDGSQRLYTWGGTIRHDPIEKKTIVLAGFTGNHNNRHGFGRKGYPWNRNALWFPHNDIVSHVRTHNPDILFFSGDQVYEGDSPTGADRSGTQSSYPDYLYKWYLWCWAYRDLTKDIPTVTIPDDHDVFQGNIWGAGGRKTKLDTEGGYMMPARWVRMIDRTQTSHLPDPFDPTPIKQGINVYYTALNWGRIDFAIIEDRKFKSGPKGLVPATTSGRPDHVIDPKFDPKTADVAGAKLLGDRQLKFLRAWAADWRTTDMKAALSQTIFAGMATHHGRNLQYLVADYDCNGWPQTGRNKALAELRRGFALMIGGDQHLATIVQHGIKTHGDAGFSFAVPSIANFYPRAWLPPARPRNHQPGMPPYTGEFRDGLGNRVTVFAATNPGKSTGLKPAELHDKMPGYGIVRFHKPQRTFTIECWPRGVDPRVKGARQYAGWPKTIKQTDNYGRKPAAWLPTVRITGLANPVVQVIDPKLGEIVYTLRIKGQSFRPWVFHPGQYTLKVGDPDRPTWKTLPNLRSGPRSNQKKIDVAF